MNSKIRKHILNRLCPGDFVSGETLGEELGVSRAAVSKHVKALQEIGLEVFSVTGKGYKLAKPLTLLKPESIEAASTTENSASVHVETEIDSTNSYLMRNLHSGLSAGETVVAEQQTAGRGRRGREWVSPFASHVYFSMYWPIADGMQAAMGLSLAAGLAVTDCLDTLGVEGGQLKWPNDVYVSGRKLSGVLVELEGQIDGLCHAVIGIGINVHMTDTPAQRIDQPWIDLYQATGQVIDRNVVIAALRDSLIARLTSYDDSGLDTMLADWNTLNVFRDKPVKLISGEREWTGRCLGIDRQGGLMLEHSDGTSKTYYGGELSLRASA